jgi:hypothetical protein
VADVTLNPDQSAQLRTAEPGTKLVADDGTAIGFFVPKRMGDEFQHYLEARRQRYDRANQEVSLDELRALDTGDEIPHDEVAKRLGLE